MLVRLGTKEFRFKKGICGVSPDKTQIIIAIDNDEILEEEWYASIENISSECYGVCYLSGLTIRRVTRVYKSLETITSDEEEELNLIDLKNIIKSPYITYANIKSDDISNLEVYLRYNKCIVLEQCDISLVKDAIMKRDWNCVDMLDIGHTCHIKVVRNIFKVSWIIRNQLNKLQVEVFGRKPVYRSNQIWMILFNEEGDKILSCVSLRKDTDTQYSVWDGCTSELSRGKGLYARLKREIVYQFRSFDLYEEIDPYNKMLVSFHVDQLQYVIIRTQEYVCLLRKSS